MTAPIRPLASLTGALLARKGEARPAMRPTRSTDDAGDALGWNDMGTPDRAAALPDVLIQRRALDGLRGDVLATDARGKAAFTLRLNADRHLRLRLAAATRHRSAQQIVTEALDAFLATLPEVEALARSLSPASSEEPGETS